MGEAVHKPAGMRRLVIEGLGVCGEILELVFELFWKAHIWEAVG